MKFKGTPGQLVRINKNKAKNRKLKHFRFDENGIYVTEDPRMIKALEKKFECVEEIPEELTPKLKCSKCDFEATSKGELLAHHRKEHKKGVE